MVPNISLCIPTYRRFDIFLSVNLPKYVENPYIHEIVICDEDGEDYQKITEQFANEQKIKVYKNEKVLGAFENKNRVVSLASNEWVCLMDSDNYAPPSYFEAWLRYIDIHGLFSKMVYMPMYTIPQPNHEGFNYTTFQSWRFDATTMAHYNLEQLGCMLNTGNYIFHKINYIESNQFLTNYQKHSTINVQDVIFKALLLFYNHSNFILVPSMAYHHIVHDGSLFKNNAHDYPAVFELIKGLYHEMTLKYNSLHIMTLQKWQQTIKPKSEWLYNCSEYSHLNDEWVPFPIGMGWSIIQYSGSIEQIQFGTHERLVLCAIRPETDMRRRPSGINRRTILQNLGSNQINNIDMDSYTYFTELPKYKFVISPEGNGIDCHRHYEALMAGCIPIIEDNPQIREKYRGCPILYTKDYSELSETYLIHKYNEMIKLVYDFSSLLITRYPYTTCQQIKDNGNYWAKRLTNRTWYD